MWRRHRHLPPPTRGPPVRSARRRSRGSGGSATARRRAARPPGDGSTVPRSPWWPFLPASGGVRSPSMSAPTVRSATSGSSGAPTANAPAAGSASAAPVPPATTRWPSRTSSLPRSWLPSPLPQGQGMDRPRLHLSSRTGVPRCEGPGRPQGARLGSGPLGASPAHPSAAVPFSRLTWSISTSETGQFRRAPSGGRSRRRSFVAFEAVSLVGLGINEAVLLTVGTTVGVHYLVAVLCGAASASLWNCAANSRFTFPARLRGGGSGSPSAVADATETRRSWLGR